MYPSTNYPPMNPQMQPQQYAPGMQPMGQPMPPAYQGQNQQMPSMAPQMPQGGFSNSQVQQPQINAKVRPVASYDEAKAIPTDFMGSLIIMPDTAHSAIYTKVLDQNTGASIFKAYKEVPIEVQEAPTMQTPPPPTVPVYDAREDIAQLQEDIKTTRLEIANLKKEIGKKGGPRE